MSEKKYYDIKYFNWQKKSGELGPLLDSWKFTKDIKPADVVLDFGCGGGYMLAALVCADKFGVEINDSARVQAKESGIKVFLDISELPEEIRFDKIISNHALEHVFNPYEILQTLKDKLKDDGLIIFFLPIDDWRREKKFLPHDINKHLYTWTPLLIGNLFEAAGFKIEKISITSHTWIPLSRLFYNLLPRKIFNFACNLWGFIIKSRQIKIVASKSLV